MHAATAGQLKQLLADIDDDRPLLVVFETEFGQYAADRGVTLATGPDALASFVDGAPADWPDDGADALVVMAFE